MAAAPSVGGENSSKKNRRLTRVVSTKLSIEDDDFLQYITSLAISRREDQRTIQI
jgi:hypothetical protein